MQFNSIIFLIFATLFFIVWGVVKKNIQLRLIWLTIASLFFYGWWDWRFLFLILISGLIDYGAGLLIIRHPDKRKLFLTISLLGNILSLSVFKYSGFIAENINYLLDTIGLHADFLDTIPDFFLVTPVGISFYTFQSMSYTVDVYKKELKPTKNIIHFFAYLTMFPQLVAGPIVRAKDMLPQLLKPFNKPEIWKGTSLIIRGLFKKMVIADNLAPLVNSAFSKSTIPESTTYWWVVITAFAFQIYGDFSGYTDIARGLSKWMGLQIPKNFNHPYISKSLREFWQRWHISLSTWFRDYVYIPLGGSRKGKLYTHINMWITMLISGLWHGAGWTFIIWGAWHAMFLSLEKFLNIKHLLNIKNRYFDTTLKVMSVFITLVITLSGWVFFRAENINQAFEILKIMFSFNNTPFHINMKYYGVILIIVLRELIVALNIQHYWKGNTKTQAVIEGVFYGIIITIILFFKGAGTEFIYFQF